MRHVVDLYAPLDSSSFVAPSVSISIIAARSDMSPSHQNILSSNITIPALPGPFTGAKWMTCFCPESAIEQNQVPAWSAPKNSRMSGFCPLLAFA